MSLTIETLNILFFLIPGFLSSMILSSIIVRKDLEFANKLIEAMVFNFIIYSFALLVTEIEPFVSFELVKGLFQFQFTENIKFITIILLLSFFIPTVVGSIIFYDLHMRLLRKIKVTDKTSRDTTWQDIFIEQKKQLVVHLKDERRIEGWPLYYSNTPEEGFIFLGDPAWIDEKNEYINCETEGILLNYKDIDFIEFLKDKENENESQ